MPQPDPALTHMTEPTDRAARYPVGPSMAGLNGGASAPGVAEADGHQGVPDEDNRATSVAPSLSRAADEAALHRIACRRARNDVRREERVDVRYSVEEKAKIRGAARSLNIAGAHLVGAAVMAYIDGDLALPGQRAAVDDLIDELNALRGQIARIGSNVNQIARVLNSGGHPQPVDTAVLVRTERALDAVRAAVAEIDTASYRAATGSAAAG